MLISESGLYKLIMRANVPQARPFQDWVTRDVLPSIRKNGIYVAGQEKLTDPLPSRRIEGNGSIVGLRRRVRHRAGLPHRRRLRCQTAQEIQAARQRHGGPLRRLRPDIVQQHLHCS